MADVSFQQVCKSYPAKGGAVRAVDDLTFHVEDGTFLVLVGPSGCGKTTTLRLLAGLERLTAGTIRIGTRVVNDNSPKDRDIAMVFQNYALYPHMTVFKNMAFGLKMRHVAREEIRRRVGAVADMLGLTSLMDRKPAALSGGECQRVALGRAIVRTPKVFLLDEPLSNLDARLRLSMRTEIKRIQTELGTTTIYVTHDQEEAMTLGDRVVVLRDGAIQQIGPPLELYDQPANRFVAGFFGSPPMNFLRGRLEQSEGTISFGHGFGRIEWPSEEAQRLKPHCGSEVCLGFRPEHLRLVGRDIDAEALQLNERKTRLGTMVLRFVETLGDRLHVHLVAESGESVVACVPRTEQVSPGQRVDVALDASSAHIFLTTDGEERIGTSAD